MTSVHISKMTGKLEGFKSISTNTLTNPFCIKMNKAKKKTICSVCYSHTMLNGYRKNMANALQRNSDLLSSKTLSKEELDETIILDAFHRFDAHGELINMQHLTNLVAIVNHNPHCTFALWTKRKDYIKRLFDYVEKPKNLIVIYSNPTISSIMATPPLYFDKTFNNVLEDEYVDQQNCTGQKCKDCLLCYTHNDTHTIVEKVKKY